MMEILKVKINTLQSLFQESVHICIQLTINQQSLPPSYVIYFDQFWQTIKQTGIIKEHPFSLDNIPLKWYDNGTWVDIHDHSADILQTDEQNELYLEFNSELISQEQRIIIFSVDTLISSISNIFKEIQNIKENFKNQKNNVKSINNINNQQQFNSNNNIAQNNVDILLLFSNPLLKNVDGKLQPLTPLSCFSDILQIKNCLNQNQQGFTYKIQVGSKENLINALKSKPSIIQLILQGDYSLDQQRLYLSLEKQGLLDYFFDDEFKDILTTLASSVQLAIITSCHGIDIGKKFIDAGIPIVISVQHDLTSEDKFNQVFLKNLYNNLVMQRSVQESFYTALNSIKEEFGDECYTCCCSHEHHLNCPFSSRKLSQTIEALHRMHTPTCSCKFKQQQLHIWEFNKYCTWADEYIKQLFSDEVIDFLVYEADSEEYNDIFVQIEVNNQTFRYLKTCCCEIYLKIKEKKLDFKQNHNEYQKFQMDSRSINNNMVITQKVNDLGNPERCSLSMINSHLFGRQSLIYRIYQFITLQNRRKILLINGKDGVGKTELVRYSIYYAKQRDQEIVQYTQKSDEIIDIQDIKYVNSFIRLFKSQLINKNIENQYSQNLQSKIIFCLDNCDSLLKFNYNEFKKFLQEHLALNQQMKVILIIEDEKNMGINNKYVNLNEEKLEVNELNINSSEEIITRIINQHNLSIDPKLFGRLSRAISSQPRYISLIENQLEQDKTQFNDICRQVLQKEEQKIQNTREIMKNLNDFKKNYLCLIDILKIICLFPGGIKMSELQKILSCSNYDFTKLNHFEILEELMAKNVLNQLDNLNEIMHREYQVNASYSEILLDEGVDSQIIYEIIYNYMIFFFNQYKQNIDSHQQRFFDYSPFSKLRIINFINDLRLDYIESASKFLEIKSHNVNFIIAYLLKIQYKDNFQTVLFMIYYYIAYIVYNPNGLPKKLIKTTLNFVIDYLTMFDIKNAYITKIFAYLNLIEIEIYANSRDENFTFNIERIQQWIEEIRLTNIDDDDFRIILNSELDIIENVLPFIPFFKEDDFLLAQTIIIEYHSDAQLQLIKQIQVTLHIIDAQIYEEEDFNMIRKLMLCCFLNEIQMIILQKLYQKGLNTSSTCDIRAFLSGVVQQSSFDSIYEDKLNHDNHESTNVIDWVMGTYQKLMQDIQYEYDVEQFHQELKQMSVLYFGSLEKETQEYIQTVLNLIENRMDYLELYYKVKLYYVHFFLQFHESSINTHQTLLSHKNQLLSIDQQFINQTTRNSTRSLLTRVNQIIREDTKKLFCFLRSSPLVYEHDQTKVAGFHSYWPQSFKENFVTCAKLLNSSIVYNFGILTEENLKEVFEKGCILLYITFDVINDQYLVFENQNGSARCVSYKDLINYYLSNTIEFATIDIVIIASENGEKEAEFFYDLISRAQKLSLKKAQTSESPNVILEDNIQLIKNLSMRSSKTFQEDYSSASRSQSNFGMEEPIKDPSIVYFKFKPRNPIVENIFIYQYLQKQIIDKFSIEFIKLLLSGKPVNISDCFENAKITCFNSIIDQIQNVLDQTTLISLLGEGPMLKTNNKKQTFEIKCGLHSPLDAGDKEINHTNLIKPKNFITNRKVLSFQITNILLINKQKGCFINLVGKSGTGKSYFINALGYWISKRSIFKDGVIYIPFKQVNNNFNNFIQQFLSNYQSNKHQSLQFFIKENKDSLWIFDDFQAIIRMAQDNKFDKNIHHFLEAIEVNCVSAIFITKVPINQMLNNFTKQERHFFQSFFQKSILIEVPQLKDDQVNEMVEFCVNLNPINLPEANSVKKLFAEFVKGHSENKEMTSIKLFMKFLKHLNHQKRQFRNGLNSQFLEAEDIEKFKKSQSQSLRNEAQIQRKSDFQQKSSSLKLYQSQVSEIQEEDAKFSPRNSISSIDVSNSKQSINQQDDEKSQSDATISHNQKKREKRLKKKNSKIRVKTNKKKKSVKLVEPIKTNEKQ